jgi:hypothetical protein
MGFLCMVLRSRSWTPARQIALCLFGTLGCGGQVDSVHDQNRASSTIGGANSRGGQVGYAGLSSTTAGDAGGTGGSAGTSGAGGAVGPGLMLPMYTELMYFTLTRTDPNGMCLNNDWVRKASVGYTELGDYSFHAVFGHATSASCGPASVDPPCYVARSVKPRLLTRVETETLVALIDALPEDRCEVDNSRACDPCQIVELNIGSPASDNECCGTQANSGYNAAFAAIADYVDQLAAASE